MFNAPSKLFALIFLKNWIFLKYLVEAKQSHILHTVGNVWSVMAAISLEKEITTH